MWPGILWFALLAGAMLCYPRRPRTAGVLWIMLGALSLIQAWVRGARLGGLSGLFCVGLGMWYLVRYRKPDARAKHVEFWTAKS